MLTTRTCSGTRLHSLKQFCKANSCISHRIKGDKVEFVKAVSGFTGLRSLHILVSDSKEDEVYTQASASILKRIEKLLSKAWDINNGPYEIPRPNVQIKVIPAFAAKLFKIDGLIW